MEDVLGGEAQQASRLGTLEDLVETEDVPTVRLAGAVVGVLLDLDRQPLVPEEEVEDDAAAGRVNSSTWLSGRRAASVMRG
ncbi:hypothetical protein ACGF8D_14305 [Streptomyces massasporeus]|uniref:hypothetical protein n=1 Tax=Streptomyces massasporeus TaxID=67324 RepID=UPI003723A2C3